MTLAYLPKRGEGLGAGVEDQGQVLPFAQAQVGFP